MPSSADGVRRSDGLSVWRSREQAVAVARRYPWLGGFVAELRVAGGLRLERSRQRGHFTACGDPEELLRAVVCVVPVEYDREEG